MFYNDRGELFASDPRGNGVNVATIPVVAESNPNGQVERIELYVLDRTFRVSERLSSEMRVDVRIPTFI